MERIIASLRISNILLQLMARASVVSILPNFTDLSSRSGEHCTDGTIVKKLTDGCPILNTI
jgi:hypothetical protein